MQKHDEKALAAGASAKPDTHPIKGELTLKELSAVFWGYPGPIYNGRYNPQSQKSRFSVLPP